MMQQLKDRKYRMSHIHDVSNSQIYKNKQYMKKQMRWTPENVFFFVGLNGSLG